VSRRSSFGGGEVFFDGLGYIFDGGVFAEFADLGGVGCAVQAEPVGDLAVHHEDGSDLFFGEEEDLEHQVVTLFGAPPAASLAHQDEAGGEDGFEGEDGTEEREGPGIEVVDARGEVPEDPGHGAEEIDRDEEQAADERGDGVADALGAGALGEELLLVAGDEVDVFLDVGLGHGAEGWMRREWG
jgi:hypothetical protein